MSNYHSIVISDLPGLHKAVTSRQGQGFILRATPNAFTLTTLRHTLLSCTILLACLTSKPLFFKQSFKASIHLFLGVPTERLPAYSHTYILLAILSLYILSTWPNHGRTPSSIFSSTPFVTPHSCLIRAFGNRDFILLMPSKPMRLSIYTSLILDFSFFLHIIVSIPYVRTGNSNESCKTLTHSSC